VPTLPPPLRSSLLYALFYLFYMLSTISTRLTTSLLTLLTPLPRTLLYPAALSLITLTFAILYPTT
jgi:hypothetical protein